MTPDTFSVYVLVKRHLYENKTALREYLNLCWLAALNKAGGKPFGGAPDIQDGMKYENMREILPFMDEAGWDTIGVRVKGAAYRPDES